MKLDAQGLQDLQAWKEAGYDLPEFDRERMIGYISERETFLRHFWQMWCRSC